MSPLCAPLHAALSAGAEFAHETRQRGKLLDPALDYLSAHLTRAVAHERLLKADLGGWTPNRRQPNNGSLQLFSGGASMRVLHGGVGGRIPAPGTNRARQAFYTQHTIAGMSLQQMIPALAVSHYLATWHIADSATHEIAIQIVRPVGVFRYGSKANVDLTFWLPADGEALEDLEFQGNADNMPLDIPGEDTDDDFGLGG